MQQKEQSYRLLSRSFNDPMFDQQWYIVSNSFLFILWLKYYKQSFDFLLA